MAVSGASNRGNGGSGPSWSLLVGDCRDVLRSLPAQSVHTCVTSPPYFGLRDYGTGEWEGGDEGCDHIRPKTTYNDGFNARWGNAEGQRKQETKNEAQFSGTCGKCGAVRVDRQIGLEPTPDEFVAALVEVFREVRRVLRDDGTVWLNLGDSYASGGSGGAPSAKSTLSDHGANGRSPYLDAMGVSEPRAIPAGCKPKDLIGVPWLVAFALRADGWYLRSDIIWAKPNPMPESVTDRPTKAHEYLFLLSKGPRYHFDADAIREPFDVELHAPGNRKPFDESRNDGDRVGTGGRQGGEAWGHSAGRNKRSVWTVATQPYSGAHFATFPPKLIEPCILAGCPESGTVLDPFAGAGTTGVVALRHGRDFIGIELNAEYAELARPRLERYWVDAGRPEEVPQTETLFEV